MKKTTLIIIILAIVIIGIGANEITGFISQGPVVGNCIDSDGGLDIFEKGVTKYTNRDYQYEDYCVYPGKVREHWCFMGNMLVRAKTKRCPSICKDGACVK